MLRKVLSLSVVSAILVSTVACGGSTTSLYRGTEDLGDQISNNISKIIDDAEKNMENIANDSQRYDTYDTANRIYTNGNGYINNYSKLNSDYNYNGVSTNYSSGEDSNKTSTTSKKVQNNLTNTVPKTNTITSIPVDEEDTVPKTNTIATFPVENDYYEVNDTDNNYFDDFTDSIAKIIDEYTNNDDNLTTVKENSNSINRVLNSTNNTLSSVKNDITNPNPNTIGTRILPNGSNIGMGSVYDSDTNSAYPAGSTMANNGVNTSASSDATPMIIA